MSGWLVGWWEGDDDGMDGFKGRKGKKGERETNDAQFQKFNLGHGSMGFIFRRA